MTPITVEEGLFIKTSSGEFMILNHRDGMLATLARQNADLTDWRWVVVDGESYFFLRPDHAELILPFPASNLIERELKTVIMQNKEIYETT